MASRPDDFYVGYQAKAPRALSRFVGVRVACVVGLGAVAAVVLARSQQGFAPAAFDYGQPREFIGYLEEQPVPNLRVARPHDTGKEAAFSRYLLTGPGKFGVEPLLRGLDGDQVQFRGTPIYRGSSTMIEIEPGSLRAMGGPTRDSRMLAEALGEVRLTGEIVDSKCYLGVMNPGEGKVHRACAARCISGGVPPALAVVGADGARRLVVLVRPGQKTLNREILDLVGEPVRVRGMAFRSSNLEWLETDRAWIERAGEESRR